MRATNELRARIKDREQLRKEAYPDPVKGWKVPTIGWGHTGPEVHEGLVWTLEQCEYAFAADLADKAESPLTKALGARTIPQGAFDALCSLAFNCGGPAIAGSTLIRKLLGGDVRGAAAEFTKWSHADGVINAGLLARRTDEMLDFLAAYWRPIS